MNFGKNVIIKNFRNLINSTTKRNMSSSDRFVWIDLEMTGLDIEKDTILEIACIVTTPFLEPLHKGINKILYQPNEVLESMCDWCKEHHEKNGLIEAVKKSDVSLSEADAQVFNYILEQSDSKGHNYLAGNSVYMDFMFLNKFMPSVSSLLHYRLIDVSSLKVLSTHWYPEEFKNIPSKKLTHRALDDIMESINELKLYKTLLFK